MLVEGHFSFKLFVQIDVLLYSDIYYLLNFILNVKGLVFEKFQDRLATPSVHLQQLFNRNWGAVLHVKEVGVWKQFVVGVTKLQYFKSVGVTQVQSFLHVKRKVVELG